MVIRWEIESFRADGNVLCLHSIDVNIFIVVLYYSFANVVTGETE